MDLDFQVGEKPDDDVEEFMLNGWALVPGPNQAIKSTKNIVIAARQGSSIIAVLKGWAAGGVGYASELLVGPEFRGRGVGTEMLAKFEEVCLKNSARRLALHVLADSDEQRLYERLGWSPEFEIDDWIEGRTYLQLRKDI